MKILITGGTGFVGTTLTKALIQRGHQVTILGSGRTKNILQDESDSSQVKYVAADTTQEGEWQELVPQQDALINLAGRTIFNYWTQKYKQQLYDSRVLTTKNLVAGIPEGSKTVLISASAAGYYGETGDADQLETCPPGVDYLAQICKDWEMEALKAEAKGVRVARVRLGVVLGKGGGAIETMKLPFSFGLGGPLGSGKQWFPWVHIEDVVKAIIFLLDNDSASGVFNLTAPGSVRQKDFAKALGASLHRPACMPAPAFIIKTVMGDLGKSLLQGQKVIPQALENSGFVFTYPHLPEALQDILSKD